MIALFPAQVCSVRVQLAVRYPEVHALPFSQVLTSGGNLHASSSCVCPPDTDCSQVGPPFLSRAWFVHCADQSQAQAPALSCMYAGFRMVQRQQTTQQPSLCRRRCCCGQTCP